MSSLAWNAILLGWKWLLILLVYSALLILLFAVRREMARAAPAARQSLPLAAGKLQVIQPGSVQKLYPGAILNLHTDNQLGAARDNDIILDGTFISGHHARLKWDGDTWWVEDLGSRNGTYVAGKPCLQRTPQALPPRVPLQVGDAIFELVDAE